MLCTQQSVEAAAQPCPPAASSAALGPVQTGTCAVGSSWRTERAARAGQGLPAVRGSQLCSLPISENRKLAFQRSHPVMTPDGGGMTGLRVWVTLVAWVSGRRPGREQEALNLHPAVPESQVPEGAPGLRPGEGALRPQKQLLM